MAEAHKASAIASASNFYEQPYNPSLKIFIHS